MHKRTDNSTLHIKVKPELGKGLKALARKRETSVGELVRQAVISCYQIDLSNLSEKQRRAAEAFQGGYISLGKLAEEMGMNIWNTRKWLIEHDIPQNNSFFENDVKNAKKKADNVLSKMTDAGFYSPLRSIVDII